MSIFETFMRGPYFQGGMGEAADRAIDTQKKRESQDLINTVRKLQSRQLEESLEDYIVERPARRRQTMLDLMSSEAETALDVAETKAKLPMMEQLMDLDRRQKLATAEATEASAQLTGTQAALEQQFGPQQMQSEIAGRRALTEQRRQQTQMAPEKQRAQIQQSQATTQKAMQEAQARRENTKQNAIFAELQGRDLNDPNDLRQAALSLQRSVGLQEPELRQILNNPHQALQTASIYAGEPDRDIKRARLYQQAAPDPIKLNQSEFERETAMTARNFATIMFGDARIVEEDNDDYDEDVASQLKTLSSDIIHNASRGSPTRDTFEKRVSTMQQATLDMYSKGIQITRDEEDALTNYVPKTYNDLQNLQVNLIQARQAAEEGTGPVAQFVSWMENIGDRLETNQEAAKLQAAKMGVDPKVAQFLIAEKLNLIDSPE